MTICNQNRIDCAKFDAELKICKSNNETVSAGCIFRDSIYSTVKELHKSCEKKDEIDTNIQQPVSDT